MKRIVICCDGTWQRLESRFPTNVARLATMVQPAAPDGTAQVVFHLDGVGSGKGTGRLAKRLDRTLGGTMGFGLAESVAEAYRMLVFAYQPGDAIHIFGYSRGAYTARSLAGMIRNCGILARGHAGRIGEALALYRSRRAEDHPDGEGALAFRARFAPAVVTSRGEREWRARSGFGTGPALDLRLAYVGVWDTVGALGVPAGWTLAGVLNRRHRFHDTSLSSRTDAARHAVAIDERRRSFRPALWDNVTALNGQMPGHANAPFQQRWFPGVHGAVGGGGRDDRLAAGALLWVLEGAERQGLAVDPERRAALARAADPVGGPLDAGSGRSLLGGLLALRPVDRAGPAALDGVSIAAALRCQADPRYRPRPLDAVVAALGARRR